MSEKYYNLYDYSKQLRQLFEEIIENEVKNDVDEKEYEIFKNFAIQYNYFEVDEIYDDIIHVSLKTSINGDYGNYERPAIYFPSDLDYSLKNTKITIESYKCCHPPFEWTIDSLVDNCYEKTKFK